MNITAVLGDSSPETAQESLAGMCHMRASSSVGQTPQHNYYHKHAFEFKSHSENNASYLIILTHVRSRFWWYGSRKSSSHEHLQTNWCVLSLRTGKMRSSQFSWNLEPEQITNSDYHKKVLIKCCILSCVIINNEKLLYIKILAMILVWSKKAITESSCTRRSCRETEEPVNNWL